MIADRYLERRFREGYIVGFKEGFKKGYKEEFKKGYAEGFKQGYAKEFKVGLAEGREENREHTREVLEKAGIELSPEVRKQLFGDQDRMSGR